MALSGKAKGKSGGARVITYVKIVSGTVYLVSIYDKSVQGSVSDKEIRERVQKIGL